MNASHPILSCEQTRELEALIFAGDEAREWEVMGRAGRAVGAAVMADMEEIGGMPEQGRLLVLAGKGHNGADALIAATQILRRYPGYQVDVVTVYGEIDMRHLAVRALHELVETAPNQIRQFSPQRLPKGEQYVVCLDGIFGYQFRPPMDALSTKVISWVMHQHVLLRAAVDLPSGLDSPGAFQADFTYATGCVKSPLLSSSKAGRIRYLDLGFFDVKACHSSDSTDWVLRRDILTMLNRFRAPGSDKRSFGHVLVVGGSRQFPGAVLMAVLAALRSGAGLVTAFVPESLASTFAARAPEAMWVAWPETPEGGLALEGFHLLAERLARANSLVIGPGLGRERETMSLVERILQTCSLPTVVDADALQPNTLRAGAAPKILTPHAGEYLRVAGGLELEEFSRKTAAAVILKGPITRLAWAGRTYHSFFGGPVLARGGSGDLLAGLAGGLLAHSGRDVALAAARAVVWHGRAADLLARKRGQTSVVATDLLEFLPLVLREVPDAL